MPIQCAKCYLYSLPSTTGPLPHLISKAPAGPTHAPSDRPMQYWTICSAFVSCNSDGYYMAPDSYFDKTKITIEAASNDTLACSFTDHVDYFGIESPMQEDWEPLIVIKYNGSIMGYGLRRSSGSKNYIGYALCRGSGRNPFFHWSVLRALINRVTTNNHPPDPEEVLFSVTCLHGLPQVSACLQRLGFSHTDADHAYHLPIVAGQYAQLRQLKDRLSDVIRTGQRVGRGFLIDVRQYTPAALVALMDEYNRLAWGYTNWARNDQLETDEQEIMRKFVPNGRVLEVGAGSGRVTWHMATHVAHLTATDYCEEIIDHLRMYTNMPLHVNLLVDDITESRLPSDTYDAITFWENGLGSILSEQKRQHALREMAKLLKRNGILILALRQLPQSPIDHLMPATQDQNYMGVYHTFAPAEIAALIPCSLKQVAYVKGNPRPAGGQAFFLVYRKENNS